MILRIVGAIGGASGMIAVVLLTGTDDVIASGCLGVSGGVIGTILGGIGTDVNWIRSH